MIEVLNEVVNSWQDLYIFANSLKPTLLMINNSCVNCSSVFDFIRRFSSLGSSSPGVVTERLDLNTESWGWPSLNCNANVGSTNNRLV